MESSNDARLDAPEVRFAHGVSLYNKKSYDEAKPVFEELAKLGHDRSQSTYYLGLIAMSTGDTPIAITRFDESIAADPRAADAHFYLAELLLKQGQVDLAKQHYIAVRSLQPFNDAVKSRLSEIDRFTREPTPYSGDIYDMLRESPERFAQAAVRLIDETRLTSQPIRLAAFAKEKFKWFVAIGLFAVVGAIVVAIGALQLHGLSQDFQARQKNGYGSDTTYANFNERMDKAFQNYQRAKGPPEGTLTLGIGILGIASLLFVGYRLYVRKLQKTRITIDRGVIIVESGLFSSSRQTHEIYRIGEFATEQNFFNLKTGDGALVLIQDGRRRAVIRGLMNYEDLKQLALKLRSLHLDLRSTTVNKGIMA
jgi:hypothetical protein